MEKIEEITLEEKKEEEEKLVVDKEESEGVTFKPRKKYLRTKPKKELLYTNGNKQNYNLTVSATIRTFEKLFPGGNKLDDVDYAQKILLENFKESTVKRYLKTLIRIKKENSLSYDQYKNILDLFSPMTPDEQYYNFILEQIENLDNQKLELEKKLELFDESHKLKEIIN